MADPRTPKKGEIQIVVLMDNNTFIAWAPADTVDSLMDSFERRMKLSEADRTDQIAHAAIRVRIAQALLGPDAEKLFTDVLAAGCLWLSMRHWSDGTTLSDGVSEQMQAAGSAVITASIATEPPPGIAPYTAWAFMVGDRIHDGRKQLSAISPGQVEIVRPSAVLSQQGDVE